MHFLFIYQPRQQQQQQGATFHAYFSLVAASKFWCRKRKNQQNKKTTTKRTSEIVIFRNEILLFLGIKRNLLSSFPSFFLSLYVWARLWNAKSSHIHYMLRTYLMQLRIKNKICHNFLVQIKLNKLKKKNDWNRVVVARRRQIYGTRTQIQFVFKMKILYKY